MKTIPESSKLLILSERVYRTLLILYPSDFRREYGQHMLQVFRDVCRDVYRQGGASELMNWWAAALFDLVKTVIAERRKVGFSMSQTKFIQSSGWLLILGGLFFALSSISQLRPLSSEPFGGAGQLSLFALVPAMALIALGLLGIFLRYKAHMNVFGKLALLTTLIGTVTSFSGLVTFISGSSFWNMFMIGWLIQLAGHSVFGGFAVTTHLLPKWNFALIIGSAFPLTVVLLLLTGQPAAFSANWTAFAMFMMIGLGWLLTGWALNSQPDTSTQPVVST